MSSYTKSTDFASKDALLTGNPLKVIKGTEINDEFNAIQTAVNSKADTNSPTLSGTPTAPTATAGTNTTQIATTAFVQTATANPIPSGVILLWSGSVGSIPSGWVLCDGTNSTPDLRNRFVVGAGDTYSVSGTGGSADAIVVSHTHTVSDPGHTHQNYLNSAGGGQRGLEGAVGGGPITGMLSAFTGITIASAGESGTNANLPPYYALAYIMKT